MVWTVYSNITHEMCLEWQDGIDMELGGVTNDQS